MAQIFFATRQAARDFSRATEFKSKIVDNGKETSQGKRFGCTVAVPASRASAARTVTVVGRGRVEKTVTVTVKKSRSFNLSA